MATTTNFGWTTPDDTALVKDGASAIRTLGSAIDTSMMDLKGGTTGQVLSKNSNTDMDFTWVAQDDSNAIQNALLTTTGDTIYASSASTPARLGIGTSGQVLTVSGGVPAWTTISSGAFTLLSTTTFSGASTTISSISGSYQDLVAIIYGVTNNTANGMFWCDPNSNNALATASYAQGNATIGSVVDGPIRLSSTGGGIQNPTRTATNNSYHLRIYNYASTSLIKPFHLDCAYENGYNAPGLFALSGGGAIKTTSAITALKFYNDGGTFAGGTVLLYGVK